MNDKTNPHSRYQIIPARGEKKMGRSGQTSHSPHRGMGGGWETTQVHCGSGEGRNRKTMFCMVTGSKPSSVTEIQISHLKMYLAYFTVF